MYHLSPCIVALPNKHVQSDAAAAAGYRGENWLCNALRIEAKVLNIDAVVLIGPTPVKSDLSLIGRPDRPEAA